MNYQRCVQCREPVTMRVTQPSGEGWVTEGYCSWLCIVREGLGIIEVTDEMSDPPTRLD